MCLVPEKLLDRVEKVVLEAVVQTVLKVIQVVQGLVGPVEEAAHVVPVANEERPQW